MIEAVGAIGIHQDYFASVAREASVGYLDRVFIDMMWYKAFSVWTLLHMGYNVLFQDVYLVWFRDPFPYFKDYINRTSTSSSSLGLNHGAVQARGRRQHPDAFFSDDGQRSLRYSPFYANSGFYYLYNTRATRHFAWTVMMAFDVLQTTGSHQNVFTFRLNENTDLAGVRPKLLDIREFPTGIMHHHDKRYMSAIREGTVRPYNFHMCWTAGKADKLIYFKESAMWFVKDSCELAALDPVQGVLSRRIKRLQAELRTTEDQWDFVSNSCCDLAPVKK